jgi:hypothetical protein
MIGSGGSYYTPFRLACGAHDKLGNVYQTESIRIWIQEVGNVCAS